MKPQRDLLLGDVGGGYSSSTEGQRTLYIRHLSLFKGLGLGYWKDVYDGAIGLKGETHNIVFLCLRIQWGYLQAA